LCGFFSPAHDALFLYGGVTYNSLLNLFELFSDSWVFYFANSSWVQLETDAAPGKRGGMGCDYINGHAYLTHGSLNIAVVTVNDTWKWNLATNTWTKLSISSPIPPSRVELRFNLIPGTSKILLIGGETFVPPAFVAIPLKDIWIFDTAVPSWTKLTVDSTPDPYPENFGIAITSPKWVIIQAGDAQGNLTVSDTCKPPLQCVIPASPTDNNWFIKVRQNHQTADWGEEGELEHNTPAIKRCVIMVFPNIKKLYLVGGHGWDGQHGVGEIYNPYTWKMDLSGKYF